MGIEGCFEYKPVQLVAGSFPPLSHLPRTHRRKGRKGRHEARDAQHEGREHGAHAEAEVQRLQPGPRGRAPHLQAVIVVAAALWREDE